MSLQESEMTHQLNNNNNKFMGLSGKRLETFAAALCTVERALGQFYS